MTEKQQLAILTKVQKWVEKTLGKDNCADISYRTGEEGQLYCEYANPDYPFISFEGPMYDLMNYGDIDQWKFKESFDKFLDTLGLWYEMGNAWNITLYKD